MAPSISLDDLDPALFEDDFAEERRSESGSASGSEYLDREEEPDSQWTSASLGKGKQRQTDDLDVRNVYHCLRGKLKVVPKDGLSKLISSVFRGDAEANLLDPNANAGVLAQSWDKSMQDVLEDLEGNDRRGSRKKRQRRTAATAKLSPEIQLMLSEANSLYLQQDYTRAIDLLQEVIRLEPSARPAYSTLSAIHTDLGNDGKVLQLDILAAHLSPNDVEAWKDLAVRSRSRDLLQQAIYCLTQAVHVEKDDVDALWDRADLYAQVGQIRQAANGFATLLKLFPHDIYVLRPYVPLLISLGENSFALKVLSDALEYHRQLAPDGPTADSFTLADISDLVDVARSEKKFKEAIQFAKVGQRWIQGRDKTGHAWDMFSDDREYDLERKARPNWEQNERLRWLEDQPVFELNVNLRAALAMCRLQSNNQDEADQHTAIFKSAVDVLESPEVYGDLADTYLSKRVYGKALELFYDMAECEMTNGPAVWLKVAQCNRALGQLTQATECLEAVIDADPNDLTTKLQLAEVFEELEDRPRALALVNEVLEARRLLRLQDTPGNQRSISMDVDNANPSFFQERSSGQPQRTKKRGATAAERLRQEELRQSEIAAAYQKLGVLRAAKQSGDVEKTKEWLDEASFLVDSFRETPALFPSDGKTKYKGITARQTKKKRAAGQVDVDADASGLAARIEQAMDDGDAGLPKVQYLDSFCEISFDEWLSLSIDYAFELTKGGEYPEADEVLRHLTTAAVFRQNVKRKRALIFALAACALQMKNVSLAGQELRKNIWVSAHLESQAVRIFGAVFCHGELGIAGYSDVNLQKYLLRCIKAIDGSARAKIAATEGARPAGTSTARAVTQDADDEQDDDATATDFTPTQSNPQFLAYYGSTFLANRSYQSAIVYLLRAYELQPKDTMILLSLGISYLHRAMQRQSDNRHHQLAQGFALLSKYREMRGPCQEVEYNFGRAFHTINLTSLATKHYDKVLELERQRLSNKPDSECSTIAKYAAYNLYIINLLADNGSRAQAISKHWLSL